MRIFEHDKIMHPSMLILVRRFRLLQTSSTFPPLSAAHRSSILSSFQTLASDNVDLSPITLSTYRAYPIPSIYYQYLLCTQAVMLLLHRSPTPILILIKRTNAYLSRVVYTCSGTCPDGNYGGSSIRAPVVRNLKGAVRPGSHSKKILVACRRVRLHEDIV